MKAPIRLLSLVTALIITILTLAGCKEENKPVSSEKITAQKADISVPDPENIYVPEETGAPITADRLTVKEGKANGIDVSKWQGKINWAQVKASGIDFAMIRIGFRGENGVLYKDDCADYNIQQAEKAGILIGIYFFSTAINTAEAAEEAIWTAEAVKGYPVSYPVVYDCEGFKSEESRMYSLNNAQRTDNALAFLNKIREKGYEGMLYSSQSELENSAYWETNRIESEFKIWVARYPSVPYPDTVSPDYSGKYDMWQYTNMGTVNGIKGNVDMSVSYFTKEKSPPRDTAARPDDSSAPEISDSVYSDVNEQVTAKEITNLRDAATTKSNIVAELKNGAFITRTGIGSNGWSRLNFNGQTVYAISSYLTTDQNYKPPVINTVPDDGFTSVNEQVTAKSETNLRTVPSSKDDSTIVYTLKNGEFVTRIGINKSSGWSRLNFNGQTVYAISSYLLTESEYTKK